MRKAWKIISIIIDVLIVAAIIVGIIFLVRWAHGHTIWTPGDIFGGL